MNSTSKKINSRIYLNSITKKYSSKYIPLSENVKSSLNYLKRNENSLNEDKIEINLNLKNNNNIISFRDKNLGNMLSSLGAITDDLTITTFDNPRARTEEEYFLFAADYPFVENAEELIKSKMAEFPDDVILITGSLAFAAYAKKLFVEGKIK